MNRKRRGVFATLGLALVSMLALGGLATGAQAAQTHVNGKTLAEWGAETVPFASEGTLEWEVSGFEVTLRCDESGEGTLGPNGVASHEVTLANCDFYDQWETPGECGYEPVQYSLANPVVILVQTGSCLFYPEFELALPAPLADEFGPEAVSLSASMTDVQSGSYGEHDGYVSTSSSWGLTGDYAGYTLGIW